MFQIDNSTAVSAIPAPTPAGPPGYFTDGNPATGAPASIVPAEFLNTLMMETLNVLSSAGITPEKGQYNQLALAISKIAGSNSSWESIGNKPTTIYGYGITDAYTTSQVDASFLTKADNATTLVGYGITDAIAIGQFGLGGSAVSAVEIDTIGLPGGFYGTAVEADNPMSYSSVINIPYLNSNYAAQIGIVQGYQVPVVNVRSVTNDNVWGDTVELMHSESPKFLNVSTVASAAYASVLAMTGTVAYFTTATPPAGFIKANGAAISRAAYAALFALFSTYYGAGDGSTTFNVPDLRGEFIRGLDDGRGVDINRLLGTWQGQDIQPHTHAVWPLAGVGGGGNTVNSGVGAGNTGPNTGYTGGTETRPRNLALLACIKY